MKKTGIIIFLFSRDEKTNWQQRADLEGSDS